MKDPDEFDEHDYRQMADDIELGRKFAAGEIELAPDPNAELPPPLAPGEEVMVVLSTRVPLSVYQAIEAEAKRRGVKAAVVTREWLALQRDSREPDALVHLSDLRRVLAGLPRAS